MQTSPVIVSTVMRTLLLGMAMSAFAAMACGCRAHLPADAGMGADPVLPEPREERIPTVHIAPAKGWAADEGPVAATGLVVNRFAVGLGHPRWLYVLPNGDVLVAETDTPVRPAKDGLRDKVMGYFMKRAGSGTPSANRISLLRDTDGDGVAEMRSVFVKNLNSPFGMALVDRWLYVANTDAIVRVPYNEGDVLAGATPERLADLPAGPINHHWTKDLIAHPEGSRLYATVGSNSNIGENGLANETGRASVWEFDIRSGKGRIFASGLRNPNGLAWEPETKALWVAVNERDELGDDLVPDYITAVQENGFYGWPYSYFGQHVDKRVQPPRPDLVATAIKPDYAVGSHTASLGLAFYSGGGLGDFRHGAFIGQHGSWNRKPRSGYKVIFVPFVAGRPTGAAADVLTGFVDANGNAQGRPVGVAIDRRGALLVADDVGNTIWRVTTASAVK